ncbi:response regulator [Pseudomonas sp. RT6P73]
MKLLVVEEDALLRHQMHTRLSESGHLVESVPGAEEALYLAEHFQHDLALIDLGLSGMSGQALIRELRRRGKTFPVLVLTARCNWQDKVEGLAAGADGYLTKPFQFDELDARLKALRRRAEGFSPLTLCAGPLSLDRQRKQAALDEQPLALSTYEYRILEYLMRHHQQVVAKEHLVALYPNDAQRDPNVIEVLVCRLRRKLEGLNGFKPIHTVRGHGYLFTERCT